MTLEQRKDLSIFHALDHEKRLKLLACITDNGPRVPYDKIKNDMDMSVEYLSHHLKVLIDAGLIGPERGDDSGPFYSITEKTEEMLEKYK